MFGNVKTVTDNLGQTAYYTYDAAGNLLKTIDRNQTALYNESDRICFDENTGCYRFNAQGDVVAVVDAAGERVTEYSYDPFGKLEDDENEWLKILFGIYVEDSNPFRYCAEYYDSETEFIYLRARYYSPDLQRFLSEDPIRDGNNWYAYCGNNPVMFMDPMGSYYITESYEVTYDIFGHSTRTSTGTYTLHPESWWSYSAKSALSFLPFGLGTGIAIVFEGSANVVGGSSASEKYSVVKDFSNDIALSLLSKVSEKASKYLGYVGTAINIGTILAAWDQVKLEKIAFDLLERNNISLSSTSKEELENLMDKTFAFIAINTDYYSLKIDGEHTLYEIDNKMTKAWFKDWEKDGLVKGLNNRINDLINNHGKYALAHEREDILKEFEGIINDYENRIDYVNDVFNNYINS